MKLPKNPELADALANETGRHMNFNLLVWMEAPFDVITAVRSGEPYRTDADGVRILQKLPQWLLIAPYIEQYDEPTTEP